MSIVVINNPVSGRKGKKENTRLIEALIDIDHLWINTEKDVSITKLLQNIEVGYETIVVSGGDGTINSVIQAVKDLELDVNVLVYPTGTTNEFAMHRNITTQSCIQQIKGETRIQSYDAGLIDKQSWFSYSLSFGSITMLSYSTPQEYKNKLGYLAYWVYGVVSRFWMHIKDYDMTIKVDDETFDGTFLFGTISNSFSLGNVLKFNTSDVALDDGYFEILLIRKPSRFRDLRKILISLILKEYHDDTIIFRRGKHFEIIADKKVSWNADGELLAKEYSVSVDVVHNAIKC